MKQLIKNIEKIFRQSDNFNELFDAFQSAVNAKIINCDLFKILLANPALGKDELVFFAEKIIKEHPDLKYEISLWTAQIFENTNRFDFIEQSFNYYQKAIETKPNFWQPYVLSLNLYNTDLPLPINTKIINFVTDAVNKVDKKSRVCRALSEFYKKIGNSNMAKQYLALSEKYFRSENQ